ncbi:MAG: hypothetical protein ACW975_10600, partial [Candidatus Thorarchaeota archaeon]
NPIPGHFEYSSIHPFEDCVTEMPYTIPLTWDIGDDVYIAAHAVVVSTTEKTTVCVVSEPGVDAFGPFGQYYGLDDPNWGVSSPAVATWVHPSWPSITDATWISTAYYVEDPPADSWRKFHAEAYLPEKGCYLTGSVVLATSDNAEEFYFNGDLVGTDGEVQGPFTDDHEWNTIVEYPVMPVPGMNSMDFIVRNYPQAGGSETSNPTGLIYKACFDSYREETAWGAGADFAGKNWATYFQYTIQEEDYVCPIIFAPVLGQQVITGQVLVSEWADIVITGTVHIKVMYPTPGGPAYFPHLYVSTDGATANGWEYDFLGYCVDTEHVIYQNTWYEANVYECGDDLTDVVDRPENIEYVQHILDQDWVGKTSENGYGIYTYGDVQRAIWEVIDDDDSWDQNRVDEILADAGWLILTP